MVSEHVGRFEENDMFRRPYIYIVHLHIYTYLYKCTCTYTTYVYTVYVHGGVLKGGTPMVPQWYPNGTPMVPQ